MEFPATATGLEAAQLRLAAARPSPFALPTGPPVAAAVFACFGRGGEGPGAAGDRGWAAAAVMAGARLIDSATVGGSAGASYTAGLLALREGALLAAAVAGLDAPFDLLLVDATGRDHPRRAGLALHLGAVLATPTVGVTHRPLLAGGEWPASPERGARAPLVLNGEVVGYWVRTRRGCRPLAVHAAWRTDPDTAVEAVLASLRSARTPEPLRQARRLARTTRSRAEGNRGVADRLPTPGG